MDDEHGVDGTDRSFEGNSSRHLGLFGSMSLVPRHMREPRDAWVSCWDGIRTDLMYV